MSAPARLPRRLQAETFGMRLSVGEGHHDVTFTLSRDAAGHVVEIMFVERGKVGHGLDQLFLDVGIGVSRAMQGRDPTTGDAL